jgi:hypothetical protein
MKPHTLTRRDFARRCAGAALGALIVPAASRAADLPLVDEAGAQAKALGYVHDAATVDKTKYANYVEGSTCLNCVLYQGGQAATGPCGIFPGQAVDAKGWCSAYAKKPA